MRDNYFAKFGGPPGGGGGGGDPPKKGPPKKKFFKPPTKKNKNPKRGGQNLRVLQGGTNPQNKTFKLFNRELKLTM